MSAPTARATSPSHRPRYADPSTCPSCAAPLHRPVCARCGADLAGELGRRVWAASLAVDSWLEERERLVAALRAQTAARRRSTPTDAPTRVAHLEQPPRPVQVPSAGRAAISVQHVLVGVGALLLATAAVIFLFFSWEFLGLAGRATIVAAGTFAVLAASFVARRLGLAATSEAVGALGVVLVLLDVWAARETGLLGTGMGSLTYSALGVSVAAVLLGAGGGWTGVRAGTVAAACLAPVAPALAGLAFAVSRPDDAFAWVAAGLLAGSAVALVRGLPVLPHLVLERRLLTGAAAVLLLLALVPVIAARAQTGWVAAALLLAGLALVSGGSALLAAGGRTATVWSVGFGVLAAASAVMPASAVSGAARLVVLPAAAAVVTVALRLWGPPPALRGLATGTAARAAVAVTAVAALPAALAWLLALLAVPAALVRPWSLHAGERVSAPALTVGAAVPAAGEAVAAVLAIVVLAAAAAGWWLAGGRPAALSVALAAAGAAATTVWLVPQTAVWVAVAGLAATAVLAAVLGETVSPAVARPALVTSWAAGTLAVLLSWTVEPLALAATAVGAAALVLARLRWPLLGPVLLGAAVAAVLVDVGAAVLAWAPNATPSDVAAAVTIAAAFAGAAALLPAAVLQPAITHREREAVLAVAAVAAGLGVALPAAVLWSVPVVPPAAALAATLVVAGDPRGLLRPAERGVAGGAATALAALLAWTLGEEWWQVPGLVGAAAAVTCAAVVAGLLGRAVAARHRGQDGAPRAVRLGVEWTAVAVALLVLTAALGTTHLWMVLTLLSAGCLAVASAPDRRSVAWAALLLATGALWERLDHGSVALVEAYTLPPAVVLLGVAVARRPWREQDPPMLAGAALAVLPTALAAPVGPVWRPSVLLVLAAGLVAAAAARALPLTRLPLGLAAAAVAGVWLRSVQDVAAGVPPEGWSLPAAAVAALIGLVTARGRGWTLVPALAMAAGPTLVLGGTVRVLAVLALGGAAALTGALRARAGSPVSSLSGAGLATAALAALAGVHGGTRPVELLTVPLAGVLLALGVVHLRGAAGAGSWRALGPGLALLLLPPLLLAVGDRGGWRVVGLAAAATAVVVTGVRLRWQAPLVLGSAVLCAHALVQMWPALTALYEVVPRWVSLGTAGGLLLALGARYERRLDDVRSVQARVTAMR